ncbi:unnamed protein product [Rhizopus stolonifer]
MSKKVRSKRRILPKRSIIDVEFVSPKTHSLQDLLCTTQLPSQNDYTVISELFGMKEKDTIKAPLPPESLPHISIGRPTRSRLPSRKFLNIESSFTSHQHTQDTLAQDTKHSENIPVDNEQAIEALSIQNDSSVLDTERDQIGKEEDTEKEARIDSHVEKDTSIDGVEEVCERESIKECEEVVAKEVWLEDREEKINEISQEKINEINEEKINEIGEEETYEISEEETYEDCAEVINTENRKEEMNKENKEEEMNKEYNKKEKEKPSDERDCIEELSNKSDVQKGSNDEDKEKLLDKEDSEEVQKKKNNKEVLNKEVNKKVLNKKDCEDVPDKKTAEKEVLEQAVKIPTTKKRKNRSCESEESFMVPPKKLPKWSKPHTTLNMLKDSNSLYWVVDGKDHDPRKYAIGNIRRKQLKSRLHRPLVLKKIIQDDPWLIKS